MKLSLYKILKENIFDEYKTREKSDEEFKAFMEDYVPFVVRQVMVSASSLHTLKVCSSVSPRFAYFARKNGFKAIHVDDGSHQFNFVKTKDSTWRVDLSAIQFNCGFTVPDAAWDEDEEVEAMRNMIKLKLEISRDPWKAVEIERLPPEFWESRNFDDRLPDDYTGGMMDIYTDMIDSQRAKYEKDSKYFHNHLVRHLKRRHTNLSDEDVAEWERDF